MSQYFSYIYISKQKMRPFLVIFKPKENPFLNPILASFEVLQYDSPVTTLEKIGGENFI